MARKYLTPIDLNSNEIQNVKAQQLASDPGSPVNGQWWYRTDVNKWTWRINGVNYYAPVYKQSAETSPSTLTAATTNAGGSSVEAAHVDHTHAITTSSTGTASTIAAWNSSGKLVAGASTAGADAALTLVTKDYADAIASGIDVRASVRLATTAALSTLGTTPTYNSTGGSSNRGQITWATGPTAIDSVTLANNDRILVKDEGSGTHASNGVWVRTSQNTWDRATDFDSDAEATAGAFFFVEEGTNYSDSGWVLTTNNPITLGGASGTAITFAQFTGAGAIVAGGGLTKTGSTLDVGAGTGITVNANDVAITTNGVTFSLIQQSAAAGLSVIGRSTNGAANFAEITAGSDYQVLRRSSSTALGFGSIDLSQSGAVGTSVLTYANGGTGQSTYAAGDFVYASAINTLAKRTIGSTGDLLTVVGGVPTWQSPATSSIPKKYSVQVGDNASTSITVTHNLNSQDVIVQVYQNSSTWDEVECDIQHSTVNTCTLIFATAPTTNQYKCVVIG